MDKTINQYINQLHLDPKRETAVRKLVESVEESPQVDKLVEALTIKPKYEFVDLGLPSGIKWATCNIGANSPEEYGLYFAWGETEGYTVEDFAAGKKLFAETDYKFGEIYNPTKYNTDDGLTILELEDDAAYQHYKYCRIPTEEEYEELINNTVISFENLNGVQGIKCSAQNGNYIFIPSAGTIQNSEIIGVNHYTHIWTSSINLRYEESGRAFYMYHRDQSVDIEYLFRYTGTTIRPVQDANIISKSGLFNPADYVTKTELDKTVKQLTIKSFVSTILANDASNEDIINKINELINGLISIGIIENES